MADTELESIEVQTDRIIAKIEKIQGIIAAAHLELDYWRIPSTDPDTGKLLTLAGRIALMGNQGGIYRPSAVGVRPVAVG